MHCDTGCDVGISVFPQISNLAVSPAKYIIGHGEVALRLS